MTSNKDIISKAQRNLSTSKVPRKFADEVIVLTTVKSRTRKEDKKVEREGLITLAFVDGITAQPIEVISLLPSTAESLAGTLAKVLTDLRKEMKRKTIKKKKKKVASTSNDYIR